MNAVLYYFAIWFTIGALSGFVLLWIEHIEDRKAILLKEILVNFFVGGILGLISLGIVIYEALKNLKFLFYPLRDKISKILNTEIIGYPKPKKIKKEAKKSKEYGYKSWPGE